MFGDRFFGARYFGNRYFGPLATGDLSILGAHYSDADTFGAATIGRGAVSITGVLYADADTFGAHTVSASYTVTGALYGDADTFGASAVSSAYYITGAIYADPDTFGTTVLSASYSVRANFYTDPDTFGMSSVVGHVIQYVSPGHERCMRCGSVRGRSRLRLEWTGLLVCASTCWEAKHPQLTLRGVADDQTIPWARPAQDPVFLDANDVTADDL